MSLTSKLFSAPRRLVLGASLAAAALAGCGGGGTEPKPAVSVSASVTPSSLTAGQNFNYNCTATSSGGGSVSSIQALYNGAQINSANAVSISGTYAPAASGTFRCDAQGNPIASSNSVSVTVNVPPTPTLSIVDATFPEDSARVTTLTPTNCTNPVFTLQTPVAGHAPTLTGNQLTRKASADANGTYNGGVQVVCTEGTVVAPFRDNVSVMTDFGYELREARSDSLITTPATIQIGGVTYTATNGRFRDQVVPGSKTVRLAANAETFKSDCVQKSDGSRAGINWEGNDLITVDFGSDFANSAKIIRLAKEGSPYGSLTEMMRIYNAVWVPDGQHVVPVFPQARISIYNGPANANWGCNLAPNAGQLDIMTQGAIDTKANFQNSDYQIAIDTIAAMPSATPQAIPEGDQILCMTNMFGNSNGTLRNANGKIRGSVAYLNIGFDRPVVRDELYEMHSGQKLEDNDNGNTFFAKNRPNGIMDLILGDVDLIQNVNKFARDAERKRLANNSTPYVLRQ